MDTKLLEGFAKSARRELLIAVEARVSTVLAAGSVARSERGETVRRLESEIVEHDRKYVIDRVAYTWFNRLIALRFMDARGYTGTGIVSPPTGQSHGQPEILADAKRGDIDTEVVTNTGAHKAIIGLLDGSRRSTDAEGEAYALLLTEYCRHWHKTMPFMFEAGGAYTELLVPAGLLADGALLARCRDVLTTDVCVDVEVIGWLYQFYISERKDEVFAGFKNNKKAGVDEIPAATQLFTPHWIVRYLLENSLGRLWMLNRPASRLVEQMDYYIAPVEEETDYLKVSGPEELSVLDPACGSGHMLTYAFDLLYAIYEEEGYAPSDIPSLILTHNLHGTEIDGRAAALAAFALTMKARAQDRRFFTLERAQPKICVIEPITFTPDEMDLLITAGGDRHAEEAFWNQFRDADILGSLIQPDAAVTKQAAATVDALGDLHDTLYYDTVARARRAVTQAKILSSTYTVVAANPPYMGTRNMEARVASWARACYQTSKADLFAMFIERCIELVLPHGLVAMITMQGWMFLSTYESLRLRIMEDAPIVAMAHLGTGAFASIGGEVVGTTAFILGTERARHLAGTFVRLNDKRNEESKRAALVAAIQSPSESMYRVSSADLATVPGRPVAYWTEVALRRAFSAPMTFGSDFTPRKGNDTGDNNAFLRQWWEISKSSIGFDIPSREEARVSGRRWFPYNKGGGFRKWYGNFDLVVDWQDDGRRIRAFVDAAGKPRSNLRNQGYFFTEGVTWSDISSSTFAARYLPPGFLCDNSGSACYGSPKTLPSALGFLCSTVAYEMLMTVNPTLHFQAGNLSNLPLRVPETKELPRIVSECVAISKADWSMRETAWSYGSSPLAFGNPTSVRLSDRWKIWSHDCVQSRLRLQQLEMENNRIWSQEFGLEAVVSDVVDFDQSSLIRPSRETDVADLISYAVGCMFGRYSLDKPGLILADQAAKLEDYIDMVTMGSVSDVTYMPDADNVIPFVDDGWFEDDIVDRFREFLKVAFGTEHFEENLRFVEESLGVKTVRDYFITKSGKSKFYEDHIKRYKKRPIYWMFSSPNGSFNALIYLHRYTPSTVSTVLNEYLREYENKLHRIFDRVEGAAAGGTRAKEQKEADRLRKILTELCDYEQDVLYPLATQQVEIDLDDGVKANYPKFYPAVKKIVGLETSDG
ncbi:BREX-1 system adenine-specific DNA-methyltransferase PglX [Rhodococcoides kroppenstedtii]|uniref:BREX-1 system adenine-specific DNA-methyltransferase PglX n=1 Tax=Rhodococcoides kroppenstedtii TaxID=293050 RepID=UPI0028E37E55|nr:BREX-1 system adenine-specific DNA-methyltransferase PglX [Rhodococcus kroppenstedtii]